MSSPLSADDKTDKPAEKKVEAKKPEAKKPEAKKAEQKKPAPKKPPKKRAAEKKAADKKAAQKKKADMKKPEKKKEEPKKAVSAFPDKALEEAVRREVFEKRYNKQPITKDDVANISRVVGTCLLYTSPSPRDLSTSRMPSSA